MKGTVLVVDDHAEARRALCRELVGEGYRVAEASDGLEGWEVFCKSPPDVVITDLMMPKWTGHELLVHIRGKAEVPVILFTARGTMESAVAALKAGAADFVSSLDHDVSDLVSLVHTAVSGRQGRPTLPHLDQRIAGVSEAMKRVRSRVMGLAPLATPVLVIGEPGTGRDAVVHALHELGSTCDGALAVIDCAAFRVEDGVPDCAAVYLDRVERLSAPAQEFWSAKLGKARKTHFREGPRILASAHPAFRIFSQLAYHSYLRPLLMRFTVDLPPLRERPEDVPDIAAVLVRDIAARMRRPVSLSTPACELLSKQAWPHNVAQLEQILERAIAFCREREIRRDLVVEVLSDFEESLETIRQQHGVQERDQLIQALETTGGNVSQTATTLGKSRGAVYRLIEKHGIAIHRAR